MWNKLASLMLVSFSLLMNTQTSANGAYYAQRFCQYDHVKCVLVDEDSSWYSLFPDSTKRDLIRRLNRMNTPLRPGTVIAIPNDIDSMHIMDISPFQYRIEAPQQKLLLVNLDRLAWGAYDPDGNLVRWGPLSGGKSWCPDVKRPCRTVAGNFSIIRKKGAGCISTKYPLPKGGAPMPYCMFFFRGFAFHGSDTVPGYHASHGCIRLFHEDAKWLNEDFIDLPGNGLKGTKVIVMRT
ncbi:L,D-transpeptidase [Spartinivicinus ruber]|uniref:L,D-transpeptidase n=1 Tax=Spartinivicinus ruber TaxID=2683272 RepID=UPI001CA3BADB|nr:L,D-transpeptidase [Spartinivicinus ruber]